MSKKHVYIFVFTKVTLVTLPLYQMNSHFNRGHVLTKTNQHVKYERSGINGYQDYEQKSCLHCFYK